MSRLVSILLVALPLTACSSVPPLPEGNAIGEPMEVREVVPFAVVDADPEPYFDEQLLVSAEITAVCQSAGCWMQVEDEGRVATVRWETGCGGKYAFPKDAVGKPVIVQGVFYPQEADVEHMAAEAGETGGEVAESAYEFNASAILLVGEERTEG